MNRRRMKRGHQATAGNSGGSGSGSSSAAMAMPSGYLKSEQQEVGIMDELLAIFGYKVQPSEMAEVVQRFEQLDMVFDSNLPDPPAHYSPCDISVWSHSIAFNDDLRAIPGPAAYAPPKRIKLEEPGRGLVLVDAQEAGIRLVHTLMACAEAVQRGDLELADALVKRVGDLAAVQPGAMRKVATCFAVALARRIYSMPPGSEETTPDLLQAHFYETGPYLKFAHFTANQAILEAFEGWDRVHVVDFGLVQGHQWPALMQALALRPAGPPAFRLTGIGPPQPDGSDQLRRVGTRLAQLAESVGVEFEFRGIVAASVADVDAAALRARPDEAVAVNAVFELHRLLARGGAWGRVAEVVRSVRPRIVTVVEQEACHNGGVFLERFTEALHYYSTMFDSLEISPPSDDRAMAELYLGRQICDVVACEGPDRVERHEPLDRWRERLGSAGFEPVQLGSNAFKQASMLLELFAGGDGFGAEENDGCLMLCWHNRPLMATSAWRLAESTL